MIGLSKNYIVIIIFVLAVISACQTKSSKQQETPLQKFSWLQGQWQRTNDDEGKNTYERWWTDDYGNLKGIGHTVVEKDTVFLENISIMKDSTGTNFIVRFKDEQPTIFKVTYADSTRFICENPENSFPKKISYKRTDLGMTAIISGGDTSVPFYFAKKINNS